VRDIFRDCHWERHGDYWILHDELGRAVGLLLSTEQLLGLTDKRRDGRDERRIDEPRLRA